MKDKKFLWLTENYPPQRGGMAQSCDRIVSGFQSAGATVNVYHFTSRNRNSAKKTQMGSYVPLQVYDNESHTINVAWNQISKQTTYDGIICFGSHLSAIAAPVFAKWLDIPLITLIRGNDFDHALFTPRKRAILNDLITNSSFCFTVSRDKANKIKKIWPESNAHYIPNGIDTSSWYPTESEVSFSADWKKENLEVGKKNIGLFGDLKPKKGALFLFESLSKTAVIDKYQFLLIGNIAEEIKTYLEEQQIRYVNIEFQDRYQLLKYYLCLDGLAIPSFYDGMPNVMLEAGALGIPIIGANVDGMKDMIAHQQDGILFHPGDSDDCRKAFYDFNRLTYSEINQLGKSLQSKITNEYNEKHEINNYQKHLF